MAEPLSDYLDRMIFSMYGATQRGYGYVEKNPLHSDVVEYIEDEKTGRPVPIEDSADHYLLRSFDRVRHHLQSLPIPKGNGMNGQWTHTSITSEDDQIKTIHTVLECNETSGEIPWRTLHKESR